MLITIGAMIGAGKTSLAELVAKHFNSEVFYESVDDNPILPLILYSFRRRDSNKTLSIFITIMVLKYTF